MKLLHIADLHLGKRVCEYPMLEDQREILHQIAMLAVQEGVSGVLIAGDVYDRPVPPQEATALLSDFLCEMARADIKVLVIAGNHDSAERLSFCGELLAEEGIHVVGECEGRAVRILLGEGEERTAVHMLSHFRPVTQRPYLGEEITTTEQAFAALIAGMELSAAPHNILLCHTFVTGAATCDSEQVSVGTVDSVPASLFEKFDYVALGHLHRPQGIGKNLRYAGSPLCYSFSEAGQQKSVTLIEINDKLSVRTLPLFPLHEMREVRGGMAELMAMPYSEDYIRAVVTDEEVSPDARVTLRAVFPNLMRFAVENSRTSYEEETGEAENVANRDPLSLFAEFYQDQCGVEPDDVRLCIMKELLSKKEVEQ